MIVSASQGLVFILGIAVSVFSVFGLYAPDRLLRMVRGVMDRRWGMAVAVIVRLILGAALIFAAPTARFPLIFEVLGWISLAAAVALPLVGVERVRALMSWFEGQSQTLVRLWLVFGAAFGGFLVYGIG